MNEPSRRKFFEKLAAAACASSLLERHLSMVGVNHWEALASVQSAQPKYVFLYFDGGIDSLLAFDPHPHFERNTASGVLSTVQPSATKIGDNYFYRGYADLELTDGIGKILSGSHETVDGKYTPPIFQGVNGLHYGSAAYGLVPFSEKTTVLRSISVPPIHDPAVRMLWSGADFNFSFPRPMIDCLFASKCQSDAILPHIIYGRSQYAPFNFPADANQLKMNFGMRTSADYVSVFNRLMGSRLSAAHPQFVGVPKRILFERLTELSYQRFLGKLPAGKTTETGRSSKFHSEARGRLYAENLFTSLASELSVYLKESSAKLTQVTADTADPGYLPNLQAALGFVKFAFEKNISRVATVNIGGGSWDAHNGFYESNQPGKLRSCLHAIGCFLSKVDLNSTTVFIMSDFGRTAWLNAAGGKDHTGGATMAIIGGALGKGKFFGAHTPFSEALPVDFSTGVGIEGNVSGEVLEPKHVMAFLLESVGYEYGRPLEILTGVPGAPAFLRKLLS